MKVSGNLQDSDESDSEYGDSFDNDEDSQVFNERILELISQMDP